MKYLKKFENHTQYEEASQNLILPNVSLCEQENEVHYHPLVVAKLYDYLYEDGSFGKKDATKTAIGVCVIPGGVLPDGKARFMSLKGVRSDNTSGGADAFIIWSSNTSKPVLPTQYDSAVCVRPNGDTQAITDIIDHDSDGKNAYMPSDKTTDGYKDGTGLTNPFDSVNETNLKYAFNNDGYHYSPSPYYSNGVLNSNYIATKNSNGDSITNALSDIDGYTNTQILIKDANVVAAKRCNVFEPNGYGKGKWYLPAIGELAFIMPRWNEIQTAISNVKGGVQLGSLDYYWSSTEYSGNDVWNLRTRNGSMNHYNKGNNYYLRAFLAL